MSVTRVQIICSLPFWSRDDFARALLKEFDGCDVPNPATPA